MKLADTRVGQVVRVIAFERSTQEADAIRLGITSGSELTVLHKMTRGPLVVQCGVNQIAVGYPLAQRITVELTTP